MAMPKQNKMKVAIVTNTYPQVSETFIVRQAEALDAVIVTSCFSEKDLKFYNLQNKKIIELEGEKKVRTKLEKVKNKILGISNTVWRKKTNSEFEEILETQNIDVVLAQFGPNGINVADTCEKLNIPFIIQFLGYDASTLLKYAAYKSKIINAINKSKRCIVLYNGMQQPFIDWGIHPEKFEVINIGVPTETITFQERKPDVVTRFISVGRMVEKKAPITTLKAFELCADRNPNVRLYMVGKGKLYEEVVSLREDSVHKDKIFLPGYLSQEELKEYYRNSHVFLQHSVTAKDDNKEGWPVSIAEACASGLPVIATRHAGIVDQIIDNETGFLVEEHDVEAMAERMYQLSLDFELIKSMGAAASKYIREKGKLTTQISLLKQVLIKAAE